MHGSKELPQLFGDFLNASYLLLLLLVANKLFLTYIKSMKQERCIWLHINHLGCFWRWWVHKGDENWWFSSTVHHTCYATTKIEKILKEWKVHMSFWQKCYIKMSIFINFSLCWLTECLFILFFRYGCWKYHSG